MAPQNDFIIRYKWDDNILNNFPRSGDSDPYVSIKSTQINPIIVCRLD